MGHRICLYGEADVEGGLSALCPDGSKPFREAPGPGKKIYDRNRFISHTKEIRVIRKDVTLQGTAAAAGRQSCVHT